ncbi:MAG: DUF302 domain-containing protein [Calditrichia bacterium]
MSYYFSKILDTSFENALERTVDALKENGFGVLTEIDIQATLKKKLDVDYPKYRILGACNPTFAHKALQSESNIGLMLPCNVIVKELQDKSIEVSAIDPIASMQAIENPSLGDVAIAVQALLKKVIDSL